MIRIPSVSKIPTGIKLTNIWYKKKLNKLSEAVWKPANSTLRVYSHIKVSYIDVRTGQTKCTAKNYHFVEFVGDQYFTLLNKNLTFDAVVENFGGSGSKEDCIQMVVSRR